MTRDYTFRIKGHSGRAFTFSISLTPRGVSTLAVCRGMACHAPTKDRIIVHLKSLLTQYLHGRKVSFSSIPIDDYKGSAFCRKIWRKTRRIPWGRTSAYAQLGPARAVGSAMRANPVPILTPCHRVLRKNGALGGYSLGVGLKEYFLKLEQARPIIQAG